MRTTTVAVASCSSVMSAWYPGAERELRGDLRDDRFPGRRRAPV